MKRIIVFLSIWGMLTVVRAQSGGYVISGVVTDAASGEPLIGANVYDTATWQGTSTNKYGFFSLRLPPGRHTLRVSFVGYDPVERTFSLTKNVRWNVRLRGQLELEEVTVVGRRRKRPAETIQMSSHTISPRRLSKLPTLLGERDPLRVVQLLPGVQAGSEASSGFHVRGGSPDQNLIILDGVTVYNVNHLFGMFSVFNADAIQHFELIKGGFPARYGGRLSSVLDIRMKEGNNQRWRGDASIGLVSSRLLVEGPIQKGKTAVMISGRRTYIDILLRPFIQWMSSIDNDGSGYFGYYFTDWNAKIHHRFSDRDRIYLSTYFGDDNAYLRYRYRDPYQEGRQKANLRWGNITQSLRWNHVWRDDIFSNATLFYTRYRFNVGVELEAFSRVPPPDSLRFLYDFISHIRDVGGTYDVEYFLNKSHTLRGGLGITHHHFEPGVNVIQARITGGFDLDTTIGQSAIPAAEGAFYLEDEWKWGPRLNGNFGLRTALFTVRDRWYPSIEPRLSVRYLLTEDLAAKVSYSRMAQFLHLLTNPTIGLPTDLWVPATDRVPPQIGDQIAAGLAYGWKSLDFTLEGYYKRMDHVIDYRDGASFIGNRAAWEELVSSGKGWAYGLEAMVKKEEGRLSGWLSYTLSWAFRQYEDINFGKPFPYKYDRRHNLSMVANYTLWQKEHKGARRTIDIGATWTYMSGFWVTLPRARYYAVDPSYWDDEGMNAIIHYLSEVEYVPERNNFRMPAYHRLDLALHFIRKKGPWTTTWTIGAYNAYNRFNPFFLYIDTKYLPDGSEETVLKQVSLYPFLPMVNFSASFR